MDSLSTKKRTQLVRKAQEKSILTMLKLFFLENLRILKKKKYCVMKETFISIYIANSHNYVFTY